MVLNREVIAFLICGGLAAFVNWAARIVLSLAMPFEAAVGLAYLIGMIVGFLLYRHIVWRDPDDTSLRQIAMFVVVNAASAVIVFGAAVTLRLAFSTTFGMHAFGDAIAHGVAIGLGAVSNFAGHRMLTFQKTTQSRSAVGAD
jgi:putative flippase GtrA